MVMRRSRHEIMAAVLRLCRGGSRITGVVYGCNLNFKVVKGYLMAALEAGLLWLEGRVYRTTTKGELWLEAFETCVLMEGVAVEA